VSTATKTYHVGVPERAINQVYSFLTRRGLGARHRHLLTVVGRRTGLPRTTPVDVMTVDGCQWLVAPYGEVQWVRNLRVNPTVTLRRGRSTRSFTAEEVDPDVAVPVIRTYIRAVPVTHSYWGVDSNASNDELRTHTAGHPVFRLTPAG
jgi:deazaflavin-dependent oxidoreductase (nitroreductase family)